MANGKLAGGYGMGGIVAVVLSVAANHSLGWAIVHFFCGWFYVLFFFLLKYDHPRLALEVLEKFFE